MRLTKSMVLRTLESFSAVALATTFLLSGCGSSGGGSGAGGTGGKQDSGMGGNGGRVDAAQIPGTGGAPGTGGGVGTGGVMLLDAGTGGSTGVDVKPLDVATDVVIDGGPVPPDSLPDKPLPSDVADAAIVVDVAVGNEAGPIDSGLPGGTCPAGEWDRGIKINSLSGLASDKDGNLFMAATVYDAIDLGSGPVSSAGDGDLVVAKLDPSTGLAVWTKVFGDASNQIASKLAIAKSGQVGVHGNFIGSMTVKDTITNSAADPIDFIVGLDSSGAGLWAKAIDTKVGAINAIAGNPAQDSFAICGFAMGAATDLVPGATATSDGLEDIIVAKINATTGAVLWGREIGGAGIQMCTALAMDAAGNVLAGGTFNGTLDLGLGAFSPEPAASTQAIWLAKLDSSTGTTLAGKSWGNSTKQLVNALALDNSGNPTIAGALKGALTFGSTTLTAAKVAAGVDGGTTSATTTTDAFAVKLDGSLNPLWAHNWGDTANQSVRAAAFDSKGNLILGGTLVGTIDEGNGASLVAATGADSYLNPKIDAFWMKVRGDTGAVLCGQNYGDAYDQAVDLLTVSPATSGPQADAVTLAGFFQGVIDFGLPSGAPLVAGVPGTSSSTVTADYLFHLAP